MNYFLDPEFSESHMTLNVSESKHATQSLRMGTGDMLWVGNGKGRRYECQIEQQLKHHLKLSILSEKIFKQTNCPLTVAIAPTKNPSRFEWFLEKATELGVSSIIPISCSRSERSRLKMDRCQRIVLAAAKQSMRPYMPHLNELISFADALASSTGNKLVSHCNEDFAREELSHVISASSSTESICLIGPEGDFTTREITAALELGFEGVSLGQNRLRTETAGVVVTACFSILSQNN